MLPAFCETLRRKAALQGAQTQAAGSEITDGIVQRLKNAIQNGETKTAGKILTELGAVKLSPEGRELYFTLYDLLMEDNTEKAMERIEEWLKY
jgi:ATP:corrinoid adenosyltransferase